LIICSADKLKSLINSVFGVFFFCFFDAVRVPFSGAAATAAVISRLIYLIIDDPAGGSGSGSGSGG
jgi:hypothetical protein